MSRVSRESDLLHERACLLASEAIDVDLEPGDTAWLADHLQGCAECRAIADEYRALHDELRSLPLPEPPRDLWARTSAGLDAVDRSAWQKGTAARLGFGSWAANRSFLGSAVAVALVVAIAGVSLLSQVPGRHGSGSAGPSHIAFVSSSPATSPEAPLGVVDGTGYWMLQKGETYQIQGGLAQCSGGTINGCSVSSDSGTTMGSITSTTPVSAALSSDARQAAVWNGDTIAVLPLTPEPAPAAIDRLTPRPTMSASAAATPAQPTPTVTATSTAAPSPSATPASTKTAAPSSSATPAFTKAPTPSASEKIAPSPTTASSPALAVSEPTAILTGYEVVGRDPEFSADGSWVAFSAVPANHGTGPDVFVWRVGQGKAHAVTSRHADFFSGWFGSQILISELSEGHGGAVASASPPDMTAPTSGPSATSYLFDPVAGTAQRIDQPMLLPVADPTLTFLVYWSGTIELDAASGQLHAGKGNLYLDSWANLKLEPASLDGKAPAPSATTSREPSASPTTESPASDQATASPSSASADGSQRPSDTLQPTASPMLPELLRVSAADNVSRWVVRWDATGQHVAVWVADPSGQAVGVVSLFAIDREAGLVATHRPLLTARGLSTVQFDNGFLAYTTPVEGGNGKTYLVPVPPTPATQATPVPPSPSPSPSPKVHEVPSEKPTLGVPPTASPTDGPGS